MLKKKTHKTGALIFLVFILIISPLSLDILNYRANKAEAIEEWNIDEDTIWKKSDNIFVDKKVRIRNGATLTIEKGATIHFTNHGDTCETPTVNIENGRILAEGTKDDQITFVSSEGEYAFTFVFKGKPYNNASVFRYAKFERGGFRSCPILYKNIFNSVYASDFDTPTLYYFSGKVHIENSEFKNSYWQDLGVFTNITESNVGDYFEIINSNFSGSGNNTVLTSSINCYIEEADGCKNSKAKVLLKNNWYGKFGGPTEEGDNSPDKGGKITGSYALDGYRNNDLISDPIVIIPGIMGSSEVAGKLVLDPIVKIYNNLINSLDQNGYQENINLFEFPYEWRNSNEITAENLKTKIQEVISETKNSKVDLVAHSMGGLIARYYIENTNYQNNVDQLITLGTPHKGAPESYLIWEAGEKGNNLEDIIIREIFKIEAKHNGYNDLKEYIQKEVVSVGELLPDYDYLERSGEIQDYPDGYPRNEFLENLNDSDNLINLDKINFINIIGKEKNTISGFRVAGSTENDKWEHGMPENFYDASTDQGIEYDEGDGTVPLESSTGIASNKTMELDANHSQLPSRAQCKILAELSNRSENDCLYINDTAEVISLLTFGVFSPIDIQVISPSGKKVGKDFENDVIINEIEGAYYTGFDTENEFLTIPNPEDGEYRILTQGMGDGDYKIEVAKISESEDGSENATESIVEIMGTATSGSQTEEEVKVYGNEVSAGDTTPPTITAVATTEPNENGWYSSDVTIHFSATDDESGIDGESEKDVVVSEEGENLSATETFQDLAGNSVPKTYSGINIDKTAPETEVEIAGTKGKNDWYTSDVEIKFIANNGLSGVDKIYYSLDGAEYEIGDSAVISKEGESIVKYYAKDLAENIETEKELVVRIDKTAPVVSIVSPENKKYSNSKMLDIEYDVSDSNDVQTKVFFDGNQIEDSKVDLSLQNLGSHSISVSAEDEAGNETVEKVDFEIITSIGAIISNVNHYSKLKLITSWKTKRTLEVKLRNIRERMKLLNIFESKWMPKWAKNKVVENLKREINREIDHLISQIENDKKMNQAILSPAKELLVENLNYLKK